MAYTIIRPADKQGWLAEREKGIGSSEVGTILGVNPWQTPYQLWRIKTGLDAPVQENEAMKAGHYLEGAVSTFYVDATGRQVIKSSEGDWLAVDKDKTFLRVSPDRTYWLDGKHSKYNKGILECKTTQMDISPDDIPQHWFCQLQYQLGVMGYQQGSLAWLTRGRKFGYIDVAFDKDFYAFMTEKLEKFWVDNIKGGKEPEAVSITDISLKFPRSSADKSIEATQEIIDKVQTLRSLKPQIDNLTSQKKELEDAIKATMADAETIVLPGTLETNPSVLCTYKSAKDGVKFDEKRFAKEHADLYAEYMIPTIGSRRFLLK